MQLGKDNFFVFKEADRMMRNLLKEQLHNFPFSKGYVEPAIKTFEL
jgi:hypothetical protein